jgi:FkbM family methyltransferase
MKTAIRNSLAYFFRTLPDFKGKLRLGPAILPLMTNYLNEQECLVTIKMRDDTIMSLDLRSYLEQKVVFSCEYDADIINAISSILKPHSNVLDIGANVGLYSIPLGKKLKKLSGEGQLWAVEPVKPNFNRLVNLVELNQLYNTIHPINVALGNQEGEIQLQLTELNNSITGNAFWVKELMPERIDITSYSSQITKLDTLATKYNITSCDFIKVDIEGAEMEFLKGGINFITKTRPIIYGEFNRFWVKEFGYSFLDVAKLAKSWHYNLYKQVGRKNFIEIKEAQIGIQDVLMVPQEKSSSILDAWNVLN